MKSILQFLRKSFDKQIDGAGLAIFRMAYSIVLLCEIGHLYYFRHLIFDKIPYIGLAEIDFGIPIAIWFVAVIFVLFGAFTRFFSILNYILGLIVIGSIHTFEYHVFYAYMGINFLLMFMPIGQCLSIDRLFIKLKYSNTTFQYNPPKTVSQLYYFIPPFVGIGLVYFDSVFFKLSSSMWMEGLGSWLPSSLPMITHVKTSFLLNQEYLVKSIGWITIAFEAIFLLLFFRKKWRLPIFILGMILHLGILLQFPIPWFALTVCAIYLLMVPVSFWKNIFTVKEPKRTLTFYYDAECPLCIRTKIVISHLDWFGKIDFKTVQFDASDCSQLKDIDEEVLLNNIYSVGLNGKIYSSVDTYIQVLKRIFYLYPLALLLQLPGIYQLAKKVYGYIAANRNTERCTEENCGYNPPQLPNDEKFKILQNYTLADLKYNLLVTLLAIITLLQMGLLNRTWFIEDIKKMSGVYHTRVDRMLSSVIDSYMPVTKSVFGITNHPVFSNEYHFDGYNHIVSVVYLDKYNKENWLPIIDKNGQPGFYIYGPNWVNWTFRVNARKIKLERLASGIERYTAFWAEKNNIDLKDAKFLIKVKKIDTPKGWEKDFLSKQIAKPWIDGGCVEWKNNKFAPCIKDIEHL